MKTFHAVIAGLMLCSAVAGAHAQIPDSDAAAKALGRCLVLKSTGEDRIGLARWVGAGVLASSHVADLGQVSTAKREAVDRQVAALFTRLITKDCVEQAKPVMTFNSSAGMSVAFEALGRAAMQELMTDPKASAAMGTFTQYLDHADFAKFTK